jgi:hypothetical protein
MASKFSLLLFIVISSSFVWTTNSNTFYKAFGSDSLPAIDQALEQLTHQKQTGSTCAYTGGLKMKKSGYLQGAAKKISVFKEGRALLEKAIAQAPNNAEFRFIRLTIQENAPKILKYNKNIAEDKAIILAGYRKMDSKTRAYIKDYANQSALLTSAELK